MTTRLLPFVLALALAAPAVAARAQTPPASDGADGSSREALRAARSEIRQACTDDYLKLCPGKDRKEARICIQENQAKLSQTCKDAIAKAPRRAKAPS